MQMAEKHHRDWKRSAVARWTGPVVLIAILIAFHWKLVLTNQFTWLASDDLTSQVMPWLQFQASEWHADRFPLWDPYVWTGQPLLGQAQPGSLNPLNWLLFAVPLKNTWLRQAALHWHYVLIRILAALAFYWLCRDLGRGRLASLFGASVYAAGGYVASVDWPQMVSGAIPLPLVFLFQLRALRRKDALASAILAGFFLGLTWLSGHHQLPFYSTVAFISLWFYFIYLDRGLWKLFPLSLIISLLVGAAQILPTAEYGRHAVRWAGAEQALAWNQPVPYDVHQLYSLRPLSLWNIVVPGVDLNTSPFIGGVAFALAMAGLVAGWRDPRVRAFAAIMAGSLLFALGGNSIVHGLFYSVLPMADKNRVPSHALVLFHAGVCILVAWGIDHFPALTRRAAGWWCGVLGTFGALLALAGLWLFLTRVLPVNGDSRFMITAVACMAAASLMWAAWSGRLRISAAVGVLLLFALVEMGNSGGNYVFAHYNQKERTTNLRRMAEDSDIVEYLRGVPGYPFRIDYDGEAFPHNLGDWWGLEAFSANVASAPAAVMRNSPYHARVQAMMGVRYYLGTAPVREGQSEVFTGSRGRKVYRNAVAFPRAWAVHSTTRVPAGETDRLLTDPAFDLGSHAVVTRDHPELESCRGDAVRVVRHEPNRVELQARMRCRGMVILSDTYFPGWRARVDGRAAEIYETNGFVRGVVVEGGEHVIEMTYRPVSFLAGAALTLLGILAALWAAIFPIANSTSSKL
jgi:hypothetical protein